MQVGNFRFKGATCKYVTGTGGMWTGLGSDLPYSVSDVQTCQVGLSWEAGISVPAPGRGSYVTKHFQTDPVYGVYI